MRDRVLRLHPWEGARLIALPRFARRFWKTATTSCKLRLVVLVTASISYEALQLANGTSSLEITAEGF